MPNGEKAHFGRKNQIWQLTNNKGMRQAKQEGITWDLDPIPCAMETDAVTQARMMIREDSVMTIHFRDGSSYCQHADATIIKTNADGS